MRQLFVCADDGGWHAPTDKVLIALASQGRLSAVSLLVDGPNIQAWRDITNSEPGLNLGLHFALTWTPERGSSDLAALIRQSLLGRLNINEINDRLNHQLDRFEETLGRPPAFLDGHQHVHTLPGIRDAVLRTLAERYPTDKRPAIRSTVPLQWRGTKAAVIAALGGLGMKKRLRQQGWASNPDFAGVYNFAKPHSFRLHIQSWISQLADGGLLMVHPGSSALPEHGHARQAEALYLAGNQWQDDLAAAHCRIAKENPNKIW